MFIALGQGESMLLHIKTKMTLEELQILIFLTKPRWKDFRKRDFGQKFKIGKNQILIESEKIKFERNQSSWKQNKTGFPPKLDFFAKKNGGRDSAGFGDWRRRIYL